jgi:hypothetical protein
MVMAVVFVFFLTLFGLAFYRFADTDVDLVANEKNAMAALYAAQAGMEKVGWIFRNHQAIEEGGFFPNVNPFSPAFYADPGPFQDLQQVAHVYQEMLSPMGQRSRYFRINRVDARGEGQDSQRLMTCVRVQVLGTVDMDGDGLVGLEDLDPDGFPVDWDDVNRKFEAIIGLPGSLSENLSAGAPEFTYGDAVTPVTFNEITEQLVTPDGYTVPWESGFHYVRREGYGSGARYSYIFGRPVRQGSVQLPPGLFDVNGLPGVPYFEGIGVRQYPDGQVFSRNKDPTDLGHDIIFVNGNVTLQDVDFGYLDGNGIVRACDWAETDVAIISTGTLIAKDIQCGNVGRLTLVAKDILLVADYDTRINGIALASGTITLDDQENPGDPYGCPHGVVKHSDPSQPLIHTAYFIGTMLAGTRFMVKDGGRWIGWTVLFDEKVINGLMYDTTVSKPTVVYETAENEMGDFPYSKWNEDGNELKLQQGAYTAEEASDGVAATWDLGGDGTPHLMRIYQAPIWKCCDDTHDFGVTDELQLDFSDLPYIGWQDWSNYRALTFWMSLDNWEKASGTRETLRMFNAWVHLEQGTSPYTYARFYLSEGLYDSTESPANGLWKHVRVPLGGIDPTIDFDFRNIDQIRFYLYNIRLSWDNASGVTQWIDYDPTPSEYGDDGYFVFHLGDPDPYGQTEYPVRFWEEGANRHRLYYTDLGGDPHGTTWDSNHDHTIQWNPDPETTTMVDLYFEDQFYPNLRIDQIEVPGNPGDNRFLTYGLPRGFRLVVTHLRECPTS